MAVSFDSNELLLTVQDSINSLFEDKSPALGGTLNLNTFDIEGFGNIDITGNITADTITGNFVGSFSGDIFGNITGNVLGDLTGNVIGQVSSIGNHTLSDLSDVVSTIPESGQALIWTGSEWVPQTIRSGVSKIIPGNNITVSPIDGTGDVTINSIVPSLDNYDFGLLNGSRNVIDLLMQFINVDFGSIDNASNVNLDLGPIVSDQPLYSLSSSDNTIVEGEQFTVSLTTINVPNNTSVEYVITGVDSADINGASLTGQFIIVDNFASITFTSSIDEFTENETFTLRLINVLPTISTSVVITDDTVDPGDEYVSGDVDGGTPTTNSFNSIADGGTPLTVSFTAIANGGFVNNTLDGGTPSTISFTGIIEGGDPSSTPTEIYDGGIVD
jgi:hypothetical protein